MPKSIKYVSYGKGDIILFLHGWGQNKEMMIPLVEELKENYQCVILDLPGFGESRFNGATNMDEYTCELRKFLEENNMLPKYIVGHSFGGKLCIQYYLKYKDILNLPIITILDNDAKAQYDSISSILRPQDKILLLEEGEFEDLIPRDLICKVLSWNFKNMAVFSKEDFASEEAMSHILYEIFRTKGLGDFKKVEFAKMIFEYIKDNENLGEKIAKLVDFLR